MCGKVQGMTTTQTTEATTVPEIGATVTFRPEAGGTRVGVEFVIDDADKGIDPSNGKQMVGLKRTVGGRTGYRLAYAADLVAVAP